MFVSPIPPSATGAPAGISDWVYALGEHDGRDLTDAECIDAIRALEQLKAASAAAQARITVAFDRSRRNAAPTLKPVGRSPAASPRRSPWPDVSHRPGVSSTSGSPWAWCTTCHTRSRP